MSLSRRDPDPAFILSSDFCSDAGDWLGSPFLKMFKTCSRMNLPRRRANDCHDVDRLNDPSPECVATRLAPRQAAGTQEPLGILAPSSQSRFSYFLPSQACSRMAVSVAWPLSVSVYAPLSRLCAMNSRMAMDCIGCAVMPTAPWSVAVAMQNRITRSCALSVVVNFSMIYSDIRSHVIR